MSIKDFIKNIGGGNKSDGAITLWKNKQLGQTRWLAAYSSNYLDDDYPSDILSREAHIDYINKVQSKELPYPELWLWHLKGTAIGEADYLFYDDDNGIAMATGFIYNGMEKVAQNLAKTNMQLGTSHGMTFVKRSEKDKKVIDEYVTIEISILPLVAAANKMTSIYIHEENNMMSTEQKDFLRSSGMSDDDIARVESRNKQLADENSLRERKNIDEPENKDESAELEAKETTEPVEQTEVEVESKDKAEEQPEETQDEAVADEKMQAVTVEQFKSTIEYLTGAINTRLDNIEKALKESVDEIAEKNRQFEKSLNEKTLTPGNPLSSIIGKSLIDKSVSRASQDSPALEKNDPLYNDAPAETPSSPEGAFTLHSVIRKITGEKN
jgi:hypothetical protein